jgi:hypothetical protein
VLQELAHRDVLEPRIDLRLVRRLEVEEREGLRVEVELPVLRELEDRDAR